MTYIYVKKDLTFIQDPAAQTLVKAFLTALYTDEYITQCEEEFDFVRVAGELREKALSEISSLTVSSGAPEWTFEFNTESNVGQGDYVISNKRESYSDVEQQDMVDAIAALQAEIDILQAEMELVAGQLGHTHDDDGSLVIGSGLNKAMTQDDQLKAALILSSISFALWMLAIIAVLVRCVTGSHTNTQSLGMTEPAKSNAPPETA
jgi:hypothetical protein